MKLAAFLVAFSVSATMGATLEFQTAGSASRSFDPAATKPISSRSIYQLQSSWSGDDSQPITLDSMQGSPVVIAMFYTGCQNACPIIVGKMKRIQESLSAPLRNKVRFVLVSFDSDHDSPEILHDYRMGMSLGPKWALLHGLPDDVRDLAMLLGVKYERDSRGQFAHSNLITVLNPAGEIAYQSVGLGGDVSVAVSAVVHAVR